MLKEPGVKQIKLEYIGYIMRCQLYNLLQLKLQGNQNIRRQKIFWFGNLKELFGYRKVQLFKLVVNEVCQ